MLVTSRPAGLTQSKFETYFRRLQMKPLRDDQQRTVIKQRVDKESVELLWAYVRDKVRAAPSVGDSPSATPCVRPMGISPELLRACTREQVPLDTETSQRITGNPLMLSMIISIFTIRTRDGGGGKGAKGAAEALPVMPETISELYATAATTMIERVNRKESGAAVAAAAMLEETRLIEATMFQVTCFLSAS